MDTIEVQCPKCTHVLRVPKRYLGSRGTCNHCGKLVEIVLPAAPHEDPLAQLNEHVAKAGTPETILQGALHALYSAQTLTPLRMEPAWCIAFLADHETQQLHLVCARGCSSARFLEQESVVPFGQCLCGQTALSGEVLVAENYLEDPRRVRGWLGMGGRGLYAIPLKSGESVLGVIALCVAQKGTQWHLPFLTELGKNVGNRLHTAQQTVASE